MRVLKLSDTAVDLAAQNAPFNQGATVVLINLTAGSLTVQDSDASGSGYGTLATVASNEIKEVTFDKQYVKVSTAADVYAVGN
jgi:hypothetical protein